MQALSAESLGLASVRRTSPQDCAVIYLPERVTGIATMFVRVGLVCLISLISVASAAARCSEPALYASPPDAPSSHRKPDVPFCLSTYSYTREHTCEDWELASYQREVSDYIDRLNDYLSEASDFAQQVNFYVSEVESYAHCEAKAVQSQHE